MLYSAQGSLANSSPLTTEELCNEPGQPTLQKQFEMAGHPLRHIPGFCRWLLQPPIVYRQRPQPQKPESLREKTAEDRDEELIQLDPKHGLLESGKKAVAPQSIEEEKRKESLVEKEEEKLKSAVKQRPIAPTIKPLAPPETKPANKQVELEAVEQAAQQITSKQAPERPTLEPETETGWQVSAGATEASYSERGYEVALQGQLLGARYTRVGPWGVSYGLQQHWLREEGKAQIGNVSGELDHEQWQFGLNGGVELGHQYWLRLQLTILLGWQEDRLSYSHQRDSGNVQYSETIGNGQLFWGYELSPVLKIAENWLLGTRWQQRMDSLQIRYGDGTNAEILSKPAWQIWIEYR
jgi:hypothetical protein